MSFTDRQAVAYLAIASRPDTNDHGGPSLDQLDAVGQLPAADRSAVLSLFASAVHGRFPMVESFDRG